MRPSSILSGLRPMPGTRLFGSNAACSISVWKSVGLRSSVSLPTSMQRVVGVRPHLGEVERIEAVGLGVLERHDLHLQRPAREVAALDRLEQVAAVVVGVLAGDAIGLGLGEELDALVGLEVVLHPEALARGVDPHVGVAGVAVHVPPGRGDAAVAHQPRHLVRGLGRQRPEVPLHVVVAQAVVGAALLRADEVLELHAGRG